MSFGNLFRQQQIRMTSFVSLYVSLFILSSLFAFSPLSFLQGINNAQEVLQTLFNRYMLLIFYFNFSILASLSVLHFRINDIYAVKTRNIWFYQSFFQLLFINILIWCSWFLSTLISLKVSGNHPFSELLFFPLLLKCMELFISQLLLGTICLIFYFMRESKIFSFIMTFLFSFCFFWLSLNEWPSLVYKFLEIQNMAQEFANMLINLGIAFIVSVFAYVILMKKDIL